jgi:hypothetical protein
MTVAEAEGACEKPAVDLGRGHPHGPRRQPHHLVGDPQKPQDAHSEAVRESTIQWYSNTLLSRLDDKTKDAIIVVMQRLHVDDLVGHLLEHDNWTRLHLPAIAESDNRIPLGPGHFHQRRPGDLLPPEREPRAGIASDVTTDPPNCTIRRRSKSSLRTPSFDSPVGCTMTASIDPE